VDGCFGVDSAVAAAKAERPVSDSKAVVALRTRYTRGRRIRLPGSPSIEQRYSGPRRGRRHVIAPERWPWKARGRQIGMRAALWGEDSSSLDESRHALASESTSQGVPRAAERIERRGQIRSRLIADRLQECLRQQIRSPDNPADRQDGDDPGHDVAPPKCVLSGEHSMNPERGRARFIAPPATRYPRRCHPIENFSPHRHCFYAGSNGSLIPRHPRAFSRTDAIAGRSMLRERSLQRRYMD
jgi:hypothetical protein